MPAVRVIGAADTVTSTFDRYQRIAPFYDLLDFPFERGRYRATGRSCFKGSPAVILDAGMGTGRNFPFYPRDAKIVGVDTSPAMLARAVSRVPVAGAAGELRQMDITRLDFPDRHFDAAVATFLFCVLPEELQVPALRELGRVVKPGGLIRLLEYVRPRGTFRQIMTKIWEPWVGWAYGASFDRRTQEHIPEARLELVDVHFVLDDLIKLIYARAK